MLLTNLLVALAIALGLVGTLTLVLPGTVLILLSVGAWALVLDTATGWWVFAVATAFLVVGWVAKYAVPGRRLKARGVPTLTLAAGGLLAVVGFFVIPVVGLLVGFVGGIYLAELRRVGRGGAWGSTKHAVKAVGLSILLELAAGLAAAATWAVGVALTAY